MMGATYVLAAAGAEAAGAAAAAHGMGATLVRLLTLGYLMLPLVLGAVAGLCLLIAALRRSLTGGAALALGALSAVVVLGLIAVGPRHDALVRAGEVHGLPARLIDLLAISYALLPLFLGAVAAISLLVVTIRKTLDGPSALALGGLGGVIVAGTIVTLGAHVEGGGWSVVRGGEQAPSEPSEPMASAAALDETAKALRDEIMELRRNQVVIEERASEGCRHETRYARRDELLAYRRPWYRFWQRSAPVSMLTTACFTRGALLAVVAVHLEPPSARHYRNAVDALLGSLRLARHPAPAPERFLARAQALARCVFPDAAISGDPKRFALRVDGAQIDLNDAYRSLTEGRRTERQVVDGLLEALPLLRPRAPSLDDVEAHLLPIIKPRAWVEETDRRTAPRDRLLRVPFPNDTVVVFVVGRGPAVRYVSVEEAQRWELPPRLMLEQARRNLSGLRKEVSLKGITNARGALCALVLNTADGYDAARILLPGLRDKLAAHLGPDFLVAIPHRDLLIAFPGDDPALERLIRAHVRREARERAHPITDRLFRLDAVWVSSA